MSAVDLVDALVGETEGSDDASPRAPTKAVAWARVSTGVQEERGLSIPEQFRDIRRHAQKHDIEIVEEFSEADSAFKASAKRVEFHRMLKRAREDPSVSVILVHDFSRFSRDSLQAKALVRELRQAGIQVVSLNDPLLDPESVAGVYMEAITFAKNEAYSREIAFHTRKGCRANIRTRDPETGWCYKNGGQPLWGYRSEQLERGFEKKGRPIVKSIWLLDETVVAGRPVHEWARHCLIELAAKGASFDQLRDFCNEAGIPAPRKRYWGTSTWYSLLQAPALLKYCGYAVWNVRTKKGKMKPRSEWVIVPDAHPAILTEAEAKALSRVRAKSASRRRFDTGYKRSATSPYLLSGGLFRCGRCGSNMTGFRTSARYYVCGSQPYRRGMGCGPGLYIRKEQAEEETVAGLIELLNVCADGGGFVREVNDTIKRHWEQNTGYDPDAAHRIEVIDGKVANIRSAIEEGLADTAWANKRLRALKIEREEAESALTVSGEPPRLDAKAAGAYRRDVRRTLQSGPIREQKRLLRHWIEDMKVAPERLELEIHYRLPEPLMNGVVAGVGLEPTT